MIYMPRETIERDGIFGEDIRARFDENYMLEFYIESVDGFEGDGNILMNFGMVIKDTITLVVSKQRFNDTIWTRERPLEGDLLYFPMTNSIFEINYVEWKNPFFQLGKNYVYRLTCELFTYSHEEFSTGADYIDAIADDYSTEKQIKDAGDNEDIQQESDVVVKEDNNPKDDFLNWNDSDPFGGL